MGWSDPVADVVRRQWIDIAAQEAKGYNANPTSACFQYVEACKSYATTYTGIADNAASGCRRKVQTEMSGTNRDVLFKNATLDRKNVSSFEGDTVCYDYGDTADGYGWEGCTSMRAQCTACMSGCQDKIIKEGKEGSEAACVFVLFTCAFCIVAVVWNNLLTMGGNEEFTGVKMQVAFIINAAVLLVGFIMTVICAVRLLTSDSYAVPLFVLMFLGVFLLLSGGIIVYGVWKDVAMLINLGNIFLSLFGYLCFILGIALAVCSGTVMGDASTAYDQNYPKLRQAVERYEPTFCQLSVADCKTVTVGGSNAVLVVKDKASAGKHSSAALWAAQYALLHGEKDWLKTQMTDMHKFAECRTSTAVCQACAPLEAMLKTSGRNPDYSAAKSRTVAKQGGVAIKTDFCPAKLVVSRMAGVYYDGFSFKNYSAVLNKTKTEAEAQAVIKDFKARWYNHTQVHGHYDCSATQTGKCEAAINEQSETEVGADNCKDNVDCKACNNLPLSVYSEVSDSGRFATDMKKCLSYVMKQISATTCVPTQTSALCRQYFTSPIVHPYQVAKCGGVVGAAVSGVSSINKKASNGQWVSADFNTVLKNKAGCACWSDNSKQVCFSNKNNRDAAFSILQKKLPGAFCQFTDAACKAKLTSNTESEMATIGIVGAAFCGGYIAVLYLTYRGILVYRSGDDDDDE